MPSAMINGSMLRYSVSGDGVPVVLTPGGRLGMAALESTAALLRPQFRVLEWDRCNTGASDLWIDDLTEQLKWVDDLAELMRRLDLAPAYLLGGSAGSRVAYLTALKHPDIVRGLVLWSVSGGPYASQLLGYMYHTPYIEAAFRGGMIAVIETPYYAALVENNPANRGRLLALDADRFIAVMRRWNEYFFAHDDTPVIGATSDRLREIECPTLVFDGSDDFHPHDAAQAFHDLVPGSTLVPCAWTRDEFMWRFVGRIPQSVVELYPRMVPTILEFIRQLEGDKSQ